MNSFNWKRYIEKYPDLSGIITERDAWQHYQMYGKSENRNDKIEMWFILNSPAFVIYIDDVKKDFFTKNIFNAGFTNMKPFRGVYAKNDDEYHEAINSLKINEISNTPWFSKGSKGCTLSHLTLLKHIIDENIPYATIFEDDIHFHPNWNELSKHYISMTPSDFDIIFFGNAMDKLYNTIDNIVPMISSENCFCTHAYFITNQGAKKLFNNILNWNDLGLFSEDPDYNFKGLYLIDVMIKWTQILIQNKTIPGLFKWYCWNGTHYPCDDNKLPLDGCKWRNCGLVFQATNIFGSTNDKFELNNIN